MHVFKYLDTMANKDEKTRGGDGLMTLRRNAAAKQNSPSTDLLKTRRQNVDSGYCTSDGIDKRWLQEATANGNAENAAKFSPTPTHIRSIVEKKSPTSPYLSYQSKSSTSSPLMSPANNNNLCLTNNEEEFKRPAPPSESSTPKRLLTNDSGNGIKR